MTGTILSPGPPGFGGRRRAGHGLAVGGGPDPNAEDGGPLRAWTALFLEALALLTLGSGVLAALEFCVAGPGAPGPVGSSSGGARGPMLSAVRALPELPWQEEDRRRCGEIACGALLAPCWGPWFWAGG